MALVFLLQQFTLGQCKHSFNLNKYSKLAIIGYFQLSSHSNNYLCLVHVCLPAESSLEHECKAKKLTVELRMQKEGDATKQNKPRDLGQCHTATTNPLSGYKKPARPWVKDQDFRLLVQLLVGATGEAEGYLLLLKGVSATRSYTVMPCKIPLGFFSPW